MVVFFCCCCYSELIFENGSLYFENILMGVCFTKKWEFVLRKWEFLFSENGSFFFPKMGVCIFGKWEFVFSCVTCSVTCLFPAVACLCRCLLQSQATLSLQCSSIERRLSILRLKMVLLLFLALSMVIVESVLPGYAPTLHVNVGLRSRVLAERPC